MTRERMDWAEARLRLERTQASLDQPAIRSSEELNRIYKARAEALARSARVSGAPEAEKLLLFRIGPARLGIPLENVAEAIGDPKIAPVMGAPKAVAGLIQLRGEVRPVWNIGTILGIEVSGSGARILLLRNGTQEFGIVVDEIEDVVASTGDYRRGSIDSVAATITKDFVTVLDCKSLFEKLQDSTSL